MSARVTSAGFVSLAALLLAALFTVATVAESTSNRGNLTNPFYIQPRAGQQHVAMDSGWELAWRDAAIAGPEELSGQAKWIRAQVPGSVQVSLFRAGELPDPYVRMNARKYDWVLGKTWYYRKSFTVPSSARDQYV